MTVNCSICGVEGVGKCKCWIMLHCPICERRMLTEREEDDPAGETYDVACPQCMDDQPYSSSEWTCNECGLVLDQSDMSTHPENCAGSTGLRRKLGMARGALYKVLFALTNPARDPDIDFQEEAEDIMEALRLTQDDALKELPKN